MLNDTVFNFRLLNTWRKNNSTRALDKSTSYSIISNAMYCLVKIELVCNLKTEVKILFML